MSSRFTTRFQNQISDWLDRECEFKLLYQASSHGFNSSIFHRECNNKGPTVTFFYNTNNSVFGGYTSQNWSSSNVYFYDEKAFLFKLLYNGSFAPKAFRVHRPTQAIYDHGSYGPVFGGHDIQSFSGSLSWCNNDSTSPGRYVQLNGSYNLGHSYDLKGESPNSITNGHMNMQEIEIFAVKGKYKLIMRDNDIMYTTQKKFKVTNYIIFVHTILNSCSYSWRERNCMKRSRQYQWACESTSTNFQDDSTVILENTQNRVFPKILR